MPGAAIGICRNPRSCNPEGNVCHYKDYACSISSARNDCCAAVGNSGVCQIDALGVPRCYGLGDNCRKTGETCASQADCCNMAPCVPDAAGQLRCGGASDAGVPVCRKPGETCSINGDCCPGYLCITPPGSTMGVCGTPPPPPSDGGIDASTPPPDGGVGCALYGQSCTMNSDCCSGVTCLGPNGVPCAGTGCYCYNIIPR
jgi:hypothetical protein